MPDLTAKGIEKAPNDKPSVYTIKDKYGRPIYVGSAQRGEVQDRLSDHLRSMSGAKSYSTYRYRSIKDARDAEKKKIKRVKPPRNDRFT